MRGYVACQEAVVSYAAVVGELSFRYGALDHRYVVLWWGSGQVDAAEAPARLGRWAVRVRLRHAVGGTRRSP